MKANKILHYCHICNLPIRGKKAYEKLEGYYCKDCATELEWALYVPLLLMGETK